MEIDASKDVYLFVHGRSDLVEKSTAALVAKGFSQEKIIQALPQKTGNVGDYMAIPLSAYSILPSLNHHTE